MWRDKGNCCLAIVGDSISSRCRFERISRGDEDGSWESIQESPRRQVNIKADTFIACIVETNVREAVNALRKWVSCPTLSESYTRSGAQTMSQTDGFAPGFCWSLTVWLQAW